MSAPIVSASVTVDASLAKTTEWLSDATRLPIWTGFFQEVGAADSEGWHEAQTLAGTIKTRIESAETGLAIHSIIKDRDERALIELAEAGEGTSVRFTVSLVGEVPAERITAQQAAMERELANLRSELS